jgi:hypothetical protein
MTTQSVTNFIFHFTAFSCSQNHMSDQLYFQCLHNTNGRNARIEACSRLRRSDQLYLTCTLMPCLSPGSDTQKLPQLRLTHGGGAQMPGARCGLARRAQTRSTQGCRRRKSGAGTAHQRRTDDHAGPGRALRHAEPVLILESILRRVLAAWRSRARMPHEVTRGERTARAQHKEPVNSIQPDRWIESKQFRMSGSREGQLTWLIPRVSSTCTGTSLNTVPVGSLQMACERPILRLYSAYHAPSAHNQLPVRASSGHAPRQRGAADADEAQI